MDGLKDLHRSGRPPEVSEEIFSEIKRELSENLAGWKAKEIMNISSIKVQVLDTMKFISIDYYISGDSNQPKVPQRRFVNTASKEEKGEFKKRRGK